MTLGPWGEVKAIWALTKVTPDPTALHIIHQDLSCMMIRVFHKIMFLMRKIGSTYSATIWGLFWGNPKGFVILASFRGCESHFRFDLFYNIDFHSALTLSGKVRAGWKSTMWKRSKQKWLVQALKVGKIKSPFEFLQINRKYLQSGLSHFVSS